MTLRKPMAELLNLSEGECSPEPLQKPRSFLLDLSLSEPNLKRNVNFECCFCFQDFEIYPEPQHWLHVDLNKSVADHIREKHPEQWNQVTADERWVKRIRVPEYRTVDRNRLI